MSVVYEQDLKVIGQFSFADFGKVQTHLQNSKQHLAGAL